MDKRFDEYHLSLSNNIDHPALNQEWKRNIDADAFGKNQYL